ncbi:melatonin receptor type 1A-like [Antedon mediterranea]|uniref:melatonin receptor type 1A-like n=1 Tax=Antedon mediterranea TaxID=105859 RepID=UPI003AF71A85
MMTVNNVTETNPQRALIVFECMIILFMSVVGSIGNIFTIFAVLTNKRLREPAQYSVVSLAIADLIPCLITDSIYVVSAWHQKWFLPNAYIVCQIIGLLTVLCLEASVMNLIMIAINRYFCIVKYRKYKDIFTPRRTAVMCSLVWIPPFIGVIVPVAMKITPFGIHDHMLSCSVESTKVGWWYLTILLVIYIPIAMVVITFCYMNIYRSVRASRRRIEQQQHVTKPNVSQAANSNLNGNEPVIQPINTHELAPICHQNDAHSSVVGGHSTETANGNSNPITKVNLKKEIRLTVNLFIIFVIFVICWLPLTVVSLIDPIHPIESDVVWQIVSILALANSSCNPVVYVWRSKHFRQSYKRLLRCSLASPGSQSGSK